MCFLLRDPNEKEDLHSSVRNYANKIMSTRKIKKSTTFKKIKKKNLLQAKTIIYLINLIYRPTKTTKVQ